MSASMVHPLAPPEQASQANAIDGNSKNGLIALICILWESRVEFFPLLKVRWWWRAGVLLFWIFSRAAERTSANKGAPNSTPRRHCKPFFFVFKFSFYSDTVRIQFMMHHSKQYKQWSVLDAIKSQPYHPVMLGYRRTTCSIHSK